MGLVNVPPPGPAIPVVETDISVFTSSLRFFNIDRQVSLLTIPYFDSIFFGTFSILFFDLYEYAINPKVYISEDFGIEVKEDDRSPPVQDSATETVNFLFLNSLDTLFDNAFIKLST